ncbi:siderophore-interacting protein [Actinomadura verrucosospora]|uniref:Siderophore-interacting protein n=1 Tax=Actinomadura verrucosospora TaxID=46165 RepID=A0A7D4AC38_ACTVE|nr:siderophore-interacting protein [Actinomadura verrucosospora]
MRTCSVWDCDAASGVLELRVMDHEGAGPGDRLPLPRGEEPIWCRRGDAPASSSEILVEAVRRLDLPGEPGFAYVAGEARTVQAVRAHLVRERGWPRRSVQVKRYWTSGGRGMD